MTDDITSTSYVTVTSTPSPSTVSKWIIQITSYSGLLVLVLVVVLVVLACIVIVRRRKCGNGQINSPPTGVSNI